MGTLTHIMVDVETTGTDPQLAGIIQLAAIKFNADTGEIGGTFDRCPTLLPRRRWEDSTRDFWRKNKPVYDGIVARQEPARQVFQDFANFCCDGAPFGGFVFVAKPVKFDWPLVESHMVDLDITFPFAHSAYLDLHSYVSGLRGSARRSDIENEVPFPTGGAQHNALHDCAYQIDLIRHAKRRHVTAEVV